MLVYASYRGERVQIIELIFGGRDNVAMINYGGIAWVGLHELSEIELIDVTFSRITTNRGA